MRKLLTFLLVVLIVAAMPFTVLADVSSVTVTGTVEPSDASSGGDSDPVKVLNVVVPTKTTFIIDENRDFISPDFVITNKGTTSVSIVAAELTATSGNTVKVVANDKYSLAEWKALSTAKTNSEIALGLKQGSTASDADKQFASTEWFSAEGTPSNINLGTLNPVVDAKICTRLDGKYGWDWGNESNLTLNYNLKLILEAK